MRTALLSTDARIGVEGPFKIGLNEVQVGLFLPPVIYKVMRRLVGSRQAERLCVGGLLVSSAEAARIGLVDELTPHERVVERAIEWCRSLLALPPKAMTATRRLARADLAALFAGDDEEEILGVLNEWFSDETQKVMRDVAERLTRKK